MEVFGFLDRRLDGAILDFAANIKEGVPDVVLAGKETGLVMEYDFAISGEGVALHEQPQSEACSKCFDTFKHGGYDV